MGSVGIRQAYKRHPAGRLPGGDARFSGRNDGTRTGARLAITRDMNLEIALGRWLAWTVHPHAAWRRLRVRGRAVLIATYVGAGYVGTLLLLIAAD
jgi:hypothetical protein